MKTKPCGFAVRLFAFVEQLHIPAGFGMMLLRHPAYTNAGVGQMKQPLQDRWKQVYEATEKDAEDGGQPGAAPVQRDALIMQQMERWMNAMERLRLSDYIRYVDDRRRMFWSNFWGGVARGVGMAVGFTILGAILVLLLQDLARRNLPLIGDVLGEIAAVVQRRME